MSHIPQRKEKDCLNCGTIVQGKYCQNCGQENVVPKETFWHMVTHFFYDITHFDSNFFHTLHHLILKPGFLSKEYMKGKRATYLHPIKMYVFSSAIFFLMFFSFFNPVTTINNSYDQPISSSERKKVIDKLEEKLKKDTGNTHLKAVIAWAKDTAKKITTRDYVEFEDNKGFTIFENENYSTVAEYDSLQRLKPKSERAGWIKRRLIRMQTNINNDYVKDPEGTKNKFIDGVLHRLPYMLFVSLPLFALILRLVYIRQRKQYYFADHGVFTIHLYILSFILLLFVFILDAMKAWIGSGVLGWITGILFLSLFFYLYKAMRNFYGQKRGKTFLKFLLVALLSVLMMLVLFVLFIFLSAFTY